ncbi:retinol dehydrogenase [Aspergillus californicus]
MSTSPPFLLPSSLTGKVFLVTGANTGIGFSTAQALSTRGARVYIGSRSREKATAAIATIRIEAPDADLHILQMDLMDLQSVVNAAKQFKEKEPKLHGLVNNAGIMATPFATSPADGFEAQWQTNYLSQWLLTWHLLDTLVSTARGEGDAGTVRVVNVTSNGHKAAPKAGIDFADLSQEKSGGVWSRYGMSKLANILHVKQLDKLHGASQGDTSAIWTAAVHPGFIDTNLNKQTAMPVCIYTVLKFVGVYSQAREGAYNSLFAVASPDFKAGDSGGYFVPGQKREKPSKAAQDMELANRLWEWTKGEMGRRNLLE